MWWILAVAILICLLLGIAVAPGRARGAQKALFMNRTYAHRGLYRKDQSIPENSLAAFAAAVEAGYGVELDVQLTSDKQVVVFHDDGLKRACGVDARVDSFTYAELTERMRLFGTAHTIPLFSEVLAVLGGKIPAIVELKAGGDDGKLCELTLELLRGYDGDYCVESFDPRIVRWFYVHAPDILRGQLSEPYRYSKKFQPFRIAFPMSRTMANCWTHAQFIAYCVGIKPVLVRIAEAMGAMRVVWTAHEEDGQQRLERQYDAIIFEHYLPPKTY